MNRNGSIIPGLILVGIGVVMILDSIDIYYVPWDLLIPVITVFLGLHMWIKSTRREDRRGVFSGTFLVVLGGFYFAWNYGTLDYYFYFQNPYPIFPMALGLAFLSVFVASPRKWWAILPAIIFLGIGFMGFLVSMRRFRFYDWDDFRHYIYISPHFFKDIFFPAILVVIGLILILSNIKRARTD
ncbi:hypothetical protein ACFL7D_04165 [candidate division KSB1 bacterium]